MNKNLITEIEELRDSINDWKGKFEKQKKKKQKLKKSLKKEQEEYEEKIEKIISEKERGRSEILNEIRKLEAIIAQDNETIK